MQVLLLLTQSTLSYQILEEHNGDFPLITGILLWYFYMFQPSRMGKVSIFQSWDNDYLILHRMQKLF